MPLQRRGRPGQTAGEAGEAAAPAPGKRTRTSSLGPSRGTAAEPEGAPAQAEALDAIDDPFGLHLLPAVQMRADPDAGGGEVESHEDQIFIVGNQQWNVRVVIDGAPAALGGDDRFAEFESAVNEGIREAIEDVDGDEFKKHKFTVKLNYNRIWSYEKTLGKAKKSAAKKITKLPRAKKKDDDARTGAGDAAAEDVPVAAPRDPEQSEREMAVQAIVTNLAAIKAVGAKMRFSFFVEEKAMTLIATDRLEAGTNETAAGNLGALATELRDTLVTAQMGSDRHYANIDLRLDKTGWTMVKRSNDVPGGQPADPLEARTVAIARTDHDPVAVSASNDAVDDILKSAPRGKGSTYETVFDVAMMHEQLEHVTPASARLTKEGSGGASTAKDGAEARRTITSALLPFTRGIGERTIRLRFEVVDPGNNGERTWILVESGVQRPSEPYEDEAEQIAREYHEGHQQIFKDFKKGVKDAGIMLAYLGGEQVAYSLVGGALGKALGWAGGKILGKLGKWLGKLRPNKRVKYLDTLWRRLPADKKEKYGEVFIKVEKKGYGALTRAEKQMLKDFEEEMGDLAETALSTAEKKTLRGAARDRLAKEKKSVAEAFGDQPYEVHHRVGLEYAHRFPDMDINDVDNLVALDPAVHKRVSAAWSYFRKSGKDNTADAVKKVSKIVDDEFGGWFDDVAEEGIEEQLEAAFQESVSRIDKLVRK